MALRMWGQVAIQATAPGEDPIVVGSLWVDTSGTATVKVCTAVSPYTFSTISGGGTPDPHASTHMSAGSDPIRLDELKAPTDVVTLNASASAHGLLKKLSSLTNEFMRGDGTWNAVAGEDLVTSDVTTVNASTAKHGFLKKLSNVAAEFMDGTGAWSVPKAPYTVTASTSTGAQNDWAPTLSGNTVIEWNGASDAAITGLAGGVTGQIVTIKNITASKIITFAHASGSSTVGNRFTNYATSAATPVAEGGYITFVWDGTNWKIIGHEQGAWITPAFSAGDFTASGSMTWTVDAGDVKCYRYRLDGNTLNVEMIILTTTTGGTASTALYILVPGGFSVAQEYTGSHFYFDTAAPWTMGPNWCEPTTIPTKLQVYKVGFGSTNWTLGTNNVGMYNNMVVEVL